MSRIRESDLMLPALYIISERPFANTTRIKEALIEVFHPTGEDNEPLAGRNDTKFTQIVRNLLGSHYDTNGMSNYTTKDTDGFFHITPEGQNLVDDNRLYLKYLFSNAFAYEDAKKYASHVYSRHSENRPLFIYAEDEEIKEGKLNIKQTKVKERSKKLREAALAYYTRNGTICCSVCGFDFSKAYGDWGDGYIQIHHEKPIYQTTDEGFSQYIAEALKSMKPLCANCHCMIHRQKNTTLTLEQLKQIMSKAKTSRN